MGKMLLLYEASGKPIINECFFITENTAVEWMPKHFGFYKNH